MRIINKSIHIINYEDGNVYPREIPDSFNEYVNELIRHINTNASVREYKPRSQTTQVINDIKGIITDVIESTNVDMSLFDDVADRLLRKEVEAQVRIAQMQVAVQRGSLIQSLLFDEENNSYTYLLAKVEHSDFVDDADFSFKTGFSKDKKTIWKSCLFHCDIDENINVSYAKIYSNNKAKFWSDDFLELDVMITDESNTIKAFKAIDEVLTRQIKKTAPNDYTVIRNSVIAHFKGTQHFDYGNMVEEILGEYQVADLNLESLAKLKEKLSGLPENKHFDRQFMPISAAINARIKKIYKVNNGIEIKITDCIDNIKETIKSFEDDNGVRFVKIKTNNTETFNYFK